jgi:hypothetical protein
MYASACAVEQTIRARVAAPAKRAITLEAVVCRCTHAVHTGIRFALRCTYAQVYNESSEPQTYSRTRTHSIDASSTDMNS